jgi:plastocyanin
MHDSLDSRALRFTDCFGQRFTEPGTYAYHALPVGSTLLDDERPFTVVVKARSGDTDTDANQSTVLLPWNGRRFIPDDPEVAIESGDLVMWHSPTNGAPPFAIVGNGFGSSPLAGECVYTHAFGSPGTYEWVDSQGSDLAGVVRVTDPRCRDDAELARWRKRLNGGTVVVIDGGKAEPAEAEVTVGQTVFFAVAGGSRVTVTDRHLAAVEVGCYPGGDGPVSDDRPAARPNRKARRTAGKASKAAKAPKNKGR